MRSKHQHQTIPIPGNECIKPSPISDPSGQRPKGAKHHTVWGCRYLCNLYKVVPRGFDGDIFKRSLKYRAFSHDVMAAILVFQYNETAAMLVYQDNPVGVELFSHVKTFFCLNTFAQMLVT